MSYSIYDIGKRKPWYESLNSSIATERPWAGLTDSEYQEILKQHDGAGLIAFYNLVEAKLKEKNS